MKNPVIVALDGMVLYSEFELLHLAECLVPYVGGFKVSNAVDCFGVAFLGKLKQFGLLVMSDPKICDIPLTAALRVQAHVAAGADFVTIHASGGTGMMEAAVAVAPERIAAVTVLSSLNVQETRASFGSSIRKKVLQFVDMAVSSGVDCIVCAPRDLKALAAYSLYGFITKMTPGIRPFWYDAPDDQNVERALQPRAALKAGSDYIIVGRPITAAKDPVAAAARILEEIS